MWSYYGRKFKIISKYPEPIKDTIIEPFSGTASYAYKYWYKDVVLVDRYDVIVRVWKYLKQASPSDIWKLPDIENGQRIDVLDGYSQMCQEERWLIGFCANNASERPKHTAGRMNFNSWNRDKIRIARDLYKIKHWSIVHGDYKCLGSVDATWFIDPPYQFQKLYVHNDINYKELSDWCRSRNGQTIVCENSKADWMDFRPLVELSGQRTRTLEVVWTNENIGVNAWQKIYTPI